MRAIRGSGVNPDADLALGGDLAKGTSPFKWGMLLYNFDDSFGTKDIGTGQVRQHWALGIEPGMIRWKRPSVSEVVVSDLNGRNKR